MSTIKDANRIIVLSDGVVVEEGNHNYLMGLKGHYYNLVMRQTSEIELENDTNVDEEKESQISLRDSDRKFSSLEQYEVHIIYIIKSYLFEFNSFRRFSIRL